MPAPAFSWWPYRTMALLIPLVALGSGELIAFAGVRSMTNLYPIQIILSVFGAGTGYLLGLMRGDFGRTILAMLAGAVAGFVVPLVFSMPAVPFVVAVVFVLSLTWGVLRGDQSRFSAGVAIFVSGLILYHIAFPAFLSALSGPEEQVTKDEFDAIIRGLFEVIFQLTVSTWYGIPFLALVFGPIVAKEWKLRTIARTASNLCNAFIVGLSFSLPLVYLAIVLRINPSELVLAIFAMLCAILANYLAINQIFGFVACTEATDSP